MELGWRAHTGAIKNEMPIYGEKEDWRESSLWEDQEFTFAYVTF